MSRQAPFASVRSCPAVGGRPLHSGGRLRRKCGSVRASAHGAHILARRPGRPAIQASRTWRSSDPWGSAPERSSRRDVAALVIALLALGIGLGVGLSPVGRHLVGTCRAAQVRSTPLAGVPTPGSCGHRLGGAYLAPIQGPALPHHPSTWPRCLGAIHCRYATAYFRTLHLSSPERSTWTHSLPCYADGGKPLSCASSRRSSRKAATKPS